MHGASAAGESGKGRMAPCRGYPVQSQVQQHETENVPCLVKYALRDSILAMGKDKKKHKDRKERHHEKKPKKEKKAKRSKRRNNSSSEASSDSDGGRMLDVNTQLAMVSPQQAAGSVLC